MESLFDGALLLWQRDSMMLGQVQSVFAVSW